MCAAGQRPTTVGRWLRQSRRLLRVASLGLPLCVLLRRQPPGFVEGWRSPEGRVAGGRPRAVARRAAGEDEAGDGPSPEAWRDFRAQLISGGLKLTTDGDGEDTGPQAPTPQAGARRPVAPKNEELLKQQSQELWNEYINGAWAHVSPVEAGGLMCRLPLPAQITSLMRQGTFESAGTRWGEKMRKRFLEGLPPVEGRTPEDLFASWSQNTNFCFKIAESLIEETLDGIMQKADGRGGLDPRALSEEERDLLFMYKDSQEVYQQVCLVLSAAGAESAAEAVTINRPLARNMDIRLAGLLLNGQDAEVDKYPEDVVQGCAKAFGRQAAVYLGGPEEQKEGGLVVHGFSELEGAVELAPGTRIYKGGMKAAIDGVLKGTYSPLDFRWFIGKRTGLSTARGEWNAVACARPIAIKQCLGLPKPLWHEVMELCGGENAELSRIEFVKLYDDDGDDSDDDTDNGGSSSSKASSQDRV